jgi:dipeptidyl aminopeptidase/acylaminoacyl peptidase
VEARGGSSALERQLQLSPDRTQFVFVSDAGGHEQLWLAPVAGGAARAVPVGEADYVESPHWSPDGRSVAFALAHKDRFDLWSVDVGSGTLTRLSSDGTSRAPSFSHDGHWLYFSSARDGHRQIWRQGWPDGAHAEALTTEGGLAALESPDGNALYYVRPDRVGLWLRNPAPGGDESLVLGELSPVDWNNWVVQEGSIWFVLRPDVGTPELARFSIASHVVTHLRPLPDLAPESGMALAPDGTSVIVATVATARADVKLAELD